MNDNLVPALVTIVTGIIGLAALSVIFSPQATTSKVLGAASQGLAADIRAAVSPVSGGMGSFGSVGNGLG